MACPLLPPLPPRPPPLSPTPTPPERPHGAVEPDALPDAPRVREVRAREGGAFPRGPPAPCIPGRPLPKHLDGAPLLLIPSALHPSPPPPPHPTPPHPRSHAQFKDWFSNPLTGAVESGEGVSQQLVERLHGVLRPFLLRCGALWAGRGCGRAAALRKEAGEVPCISKPAQPHSSPLAARLSPGLPPPPRRLKSEVERQMPAKHEHVLYCKLSKRQRQVRRGAAGRGPQARPSAAPPCRQQKPTRLLLLAPLPSSPPHPLNPTLS
jgi:hypothetical protein